MSELEAQELLARVLNDTPTPIDIGGETYYITALKIGTQNLIAEESCRIQKAQEGNMLDMFKQFAVCVPSVIKCLCYAILNDKDKIFKDYRKREYSDDFIALQERLEWESDSRQWMEVLVNVIQRIDLDFFIKCAGSVMTIKDLALKTRKKANQPT